MMDRNLGAISATPGNVGTLGLIYQPGRKDPFMGASSISSNNLALSTGEWKIESAQYTGSLELTRLNAEHNPMTYYTTNIYSFGGWKREKTMYDPCPAGWRVPDSDIWGNALGLSGDWYILSGNLSHISNGVNFSGKLGDYEMIYYPITGYRARNSGALTDVARNTYYWTNASSLLSFGVSMSCSISSTQTDRFGPVRCQKIE
jgi:hypothetical protein